MKIAPTTISRIRVTGLHNQFNVSLDLSPDLNVIFGRNGRGKTTLLHILANALEHDFLRFRHIAFQNITIETHEGSSLVITRGGNQENTPIFVRLNDSLLSTVSDQSNLHEEERISIGNRIGYRPVYLPAFRAILERVSSRTGTSYSMQAEIAREPGFEAIFEAERIALTQLEPSGTSSSGWESRLRQDRARDTAMKTIQCRGWFGQFVPVVRYPSLNDVRDQLATELRDAQLTMANFEKEMFSEVFVSVFESMFEQNSEGPTPEPETVLKNVNESLQQLSKREGDSNAIYRRIADALKSAKASSGNSGETAARVLNLYKNLLQKRIDAEQINYQQIRNFEESVNKFLDGKKLTVDSRSAKYRLPQPRISAANGTYSLNSLSSGERQVLTMLFSASRLGRHGGIFLVDEPELSLHVDWQRRILGELKKQAVNSQIIACTHAPEVGAEHFDNLLDFEPKIFSQQADLEFEEDLAGEE